MNELSHRDRLHVWHPFTPLNTSGPSIPIERGAGALLYSTDGKAYIDGIASWWVNLHGHAHPYIAEKISRQLLTLEHAIFSGFTHEPAVRLAERLLQKLPGQLSKVFYSDDGSTSVEVALKMAFQFWSNKEQPRTKVIAFENAYHGDTFGGMSVGARNAFNAAFQPLLFDVIHIPVPVKGQEEASLGAMRKALEQPDIAAFIFEPLVQGAAGMIMYEAAPLDELVRLCREKNVITIADEVMTGFGRTGSWFASSELKNKPDIVCLSKGLTGGFLPLGVTACAEFIYEAYRSDDRMKTFFHGHSYTANPTACAAALASFDVMEQEETWAAIERIGKTNAAFVQQLQGHTNLLDLRCKGTIVAAELRTEEATSYLNPLSDRVHGFFLERGIILRPLGNIVYVLPPYCITPGQHRQTLDALEEFIRTLNG